MKLNLIALAHFASLTQDNKLMVAGTFNTVDYSVPPGQPTVAVHIPVPAMMLAVVAECGLSEGTVHQAALRVVNEDNEPIVDQISLGTWTFLVNKHGNPMTFHQVVDLTSMPVPGAGDYFFEVWVDGQKIGDTALYVHDVTGEA